MVKKSVPDDLAAELRRAIEASGLSQNQIALRAGMEPSRISRFMRGERGLTVEAIAGISEVLGLRLSLTAPAAEEDKPAAPKTRRKK